jgi:transposase
LKYRIRTVRTASNATAVQVVWYEKHKTHLVKHIGSANTPDELDVLRIKAEQYIIGHQPQRSLFEEPAQNIVIFDRIEATRVTHRFARNVLLSLADQCGLGTLDILYRDFAIMRIIEPCSKRRSLQLLQEYFGVSYSRYAYERLPDLLEERVRIEQAALATAKSFQDQFALLLYDVTTLYFETHKPDDELQARGFSKDDKPKQPQVVIGLLVTAEGFPLIHEVFKGNTFEGHTMLTVLKKFQQQHHTEKPIIVADAAMLSKINRSVLEEEGYHYIVGARLANAKPAFIQKLCDQLPREDGATIRCAYPDEAYEVVCSYSKARYKKDKREFDKQIDKAKSLVARQEPGRRAKFVKKSKEANKPYLFDETLKQKAEQLLGIKGYCTNIPTEVLSNEQIAQYYHDLWRVEQMFRMSKSDLKARPIFHYTHDAIRAHLLICFMGLMIGKMIEIKTGRSLRSVRDLLWQIHEIHLRDPISNQERIVLTPVSNELNKVLDLLDIKNTH